MTGCFRRETTEKHGLWRIGLFVMAFLMFVLAWRLVEKPVVYELACSSLGDGRALALTERAIRERHPEFLKESTHWAWPITFDSGRRRTACLLYGTSESIENSRTRVFDDRLERIGEYAAAASILCPPDDRDGDGHVEVVFVDKMNSLPNGDYVFGLIHVEAESNRLIAAVRWPALMTLPQLVWSNNDGDQFHELNFLTWDVSRNTLKAAVQLRWLAPGCMTCDGPPPPGVRVWLAQQRDEVVFRQDEPLADVVKRVHAE